MGEQGIFLEECLCYKDNAELHTRRTIIIWNMYFQHYFEKNLPTHRHKKYTQLNYQKACWFLLCNLSCQWALCQMQWRMTISCALYLLEETLLYLLLWISTKQKATIVAVGRQNMARTETATWAGNSTRIISPYNFK